MAGRPWTKQEEAILTKLWEKNVSTKEISQVLGRSMPGIEQKAYRFGLCRESTPMINYEMLNVLCDDDELREIADVEKI